MTPVPLLLELLFPESAESVLPVVSPRLLDWCSAFEAWREERRQSRPPSDRASVVRSWRKLLGECSKPPWEISQEDIQQHIAWLEASGYAPSTIKKCVSCIADFYRWRLEQQPDPECPPGFNPTEGVQRPKASPNPQSPLFSKSELEALLNYMRRDVSALGRRDYAFVLARMHVGVSLQHLQRLRWEQIEVDGSGAWLRWRPGSARLPLPAEAWQAVRLWLEQSGRLPRMQPGDYIFTPLVDPLHEAAPDRPEAWDSGKFISYDRLSDNLRLYGRRLGLPEEKLNWNSLRLTAVRLRLDAGDSPEVLYNFLDRQRKRYSIQPYLKGLPELPPSADPTGPDNPARPERPRPAEQGSAEPVPAEQAADEPALPNRKPYVFQPWSNIKHGMSSFNLPPEQLSAVLAENIQGLEAEISGLRLLERALVALQITATNPREAGKLADACTLTGERLARLIEAEAQLGRPDEAAERMEGFFATMDEVHAEDEERPSGDEWRRFLEEDDDQPVLATNSRSLEEETACARLVLRNIFALAESAAQAGQAAELAHLAEIYGSGCNRLVNLLRRNRSSSSRMEKKLEAMLNAALAEEQKSWTQY